MGLEAKFKIDFYPSSWGPFAVYVRRPRWHKFLTGMDWWQYIDRFETQEKADEYVDKIKHLPTYR